MWSLRRSLDRQLHQHSHRLDVVGIVSCSTTLLLIAAQLSRSSQRCSRSRRSVGGYTLSVPIQLQLAWPDFEYGG